MSGGKDDVVLRATPDVDLGIDGLQTPTLIGQGGFGAVYRAEQQALGRTVAVKILSAPGLDDRTRERFTRECMAIGALSGHPHIVTVFDSGINGWGRPFIVMDYMARGSIADRVAVEGSIPWPEAVDMGIKLAGAVASAHAAGILHRDIKPQNVLISAYGEPKLADFGISSIGGEQTSSGSITASLEHAAPELLDAAVATAASDVYALASTIYTMVAGECAFPRGQEEPIQSVITRILTKPVPDLRPRGVPGALCDVLERALAKSPEERYASVREFAEALQNVQEQQGLARTTAVDVAPAGGFEVLDRFAPRSSGTTAPTRARVRSEYVPPAPPPQPAPPVWKRPLFVAAMVVALFAIAASAFALTRGEEERPTSPATEQVAAKDQDSDAEASKERRNTADKKKGAGNDRKGKNNKRAPVPGRGGLPSYAGGVSYGAGTTYGSGGGTGGSTASSGGSTTTGSDSTTTKSGGSGGGSGGTEQKKQPPPPPPAPNTTLYHMYKVRTDQHVMTTDPGRVDQLQAENYRTDVVGGVYSYSEDGTRPLEELGLWAFSSYSGQTSPQTGRNQLWRMRKSGRFFYTSSPGVKDQFAIGYSWEADEWGWVAR